MVRMQIQFTQQEADSLRSEASRRKVSISALVREAVDERLAAGSTAPTRDELVRRAKDACGRFRSGLGDVSARHDDYFVDSIEW
jgi:hypothetical protein